MPELKGVIFAQKSDKAHLESIGVKVGRYEHEKLCFHDCSLSHEAFELLHPLWGKYYWDLS